MTCPYVWLGDEWGEDPNNPQTCPGTCTPPQQNGTYIGQPGNGTCVFGP